MVYLVRKTSFVSFRLYGVSMALCAVSLWLSQGLPASAAQLQWDVISLGFDDDPISINAGGIASAFADGGSKLTLTGSGTFFDTGEPQLSPVTGGGTWETFSPPDETTGDVTPTGSGTYNVTSLVKWTPAPGTIFMGLDDTIGNIEETIAGLALFLVDYSDGSTGHLLVSCRLRGADPMTPDGVFEGTIAAKDFVTYSLFEVPLDGVDANRTVYHVIPEPSTMALALCFLPVLGHYRRIRRK